MELIKKQRWENLFKKRLLVHVDAVKEFYAKMSVIHLKKKDIVKSKVRGVDLEFDNEKLATILGVPGKNGICEYIKEVWEESKYTKPLEITRRFANDATIMKARRVQSVEMKPSQRETPQASGFDIYGSLNGKEVSQSATTFGVPLVIKKGEEPKKYDFFEDTFLTMCTPTREDGIWWIGSGENRRRDDDEATPEEEALQIAPASSSAQQKDQEPAGVDPSGLTDRDAEFLKFQAEFERKRANQFHDALEKAKAENAKLLALLHKAQTKSNH
ncbi:hypothetical protein Dimus_035563 [Dionaea muscipula]